MKYFVETYLYKTQSSKKAGWLINFRDLFLQLVY